MASFRDGLYRPFSRWTMVSRRAETSSASSLCFSPAFSRYSLILVFSVGGYIPFLSMAEKITARRIVRSRMAARIP